MKSDPVVTNDHKCKYRCGQSRDKGDSGIVGISPSDMDAHFLPEASATDVTDVTNHSEADGGHGTVTKDFCNTDVADEQAVFNSVCATESRDMLCTTLLDNAFARVEARAPTHTQSPTRVEPA